MNESSLRKPGYLLGIVAGLQIAAACGGSEDAPATRGSSGAAGATSNGGSGRSGAAGAAGSTAGAAGAAGNTAGAAGSAGNTAGAAGSGALVAPGITGTIADGMVVQITALAGESFGTQGPPKTQVSDRFAGKKASDPRDPKTPDVGAFVLYGSDKASAPHTTYAEEEYLSDGASYRAFLLGSTSDDLTSSRLQLGSPTKEHEVFMSTNMLVPAKGWGPPSPGFIDEEGWPVASFVKLFWLEDGNKGGTVGGAWDEVYFGVNGALTGTPGGSNETLLNNRTPKGFGEYPAFPSGTKIATKKLFPAGKWSLVQFGFQAPTVALGPTPAVFRRMTVQNTETLGAERDTSKSYIPFVEGVSTSFDHVAVAAYIRSQSLAETPLADRRRVYLDDVYMALGPGAMCRVELHDQEDDTKATIVSVSPVEAGNWQTGEITTTLRFNRYMPASPTGYYVKVYGPDGARITARKIAAP